MSEHNEEVAKLKFVSSLYQTQVEVNKSAIVDPTELIENHINQAKSKLAQLMEENTISSFTVYEQKYHDVLASLKSSSLDDKQTIIVPIAQGIPFLEGISLSYKNLEGTDVVKVTIESDSEKTSDWKPEWLKAYIESHLAEKGQSTQVNEAQIKSLIERLKKGEKIRNWPLSSAPTKDDKHPLRIIANHNKGEIYVVFNNLLAFRDQGAKSELITNFEELIEKVNLYEAMNYTLLETISDELENALQSDKLLAAAEPATLLIAISFNEVVETLTPDTQDIKDVVSEEINEEISQEIIEQSTLKGLTPKSSDNIPLEDLEDVADNFATQTATIESKNKSNLPRETKVKSTSDVPINKPTPQKLAPKPKVKALDKAKFDLMKSAIPIEIEDEGLTAVIGEFDSGLYGTGIELDESTLVAFFKQSGIKHGLGKKFIAAILNEVKQENDISGLTIAIGTPAKGYKDPYLYKSYEHNYEKSIDTNEKINLRELQQRKVAQEGDLIGEVRFREPEQEGKTVTGETIPPPPPEPFKVKVGENVEEREPGLYYAMRDGLPIVKNDYVFLKTSLVHEGDVNLTSGNIHFNGDVEIHGNIEKGAVVEATGTITVSGNIMSGHVFAKKDLIVKEGIVTGTKDTIQVGGVLQSGFIENSSVNVKKSLEITKAIINSTVVAGENVVLSQKESVIAGGTCFAWGTIVTDNLGLKRGLPTKVSVGADPLIERRLDILTKREASVTKLQESLRVSLRESGKVKMGKNDDDKKDKEYYRIKLVKCSKILETLKIKLDATLANRSYNHDAKIVVKDQLRMNSKIEVCGKGVPITNEYANVVIVSKKKKRKNIVPLETYEEDLEEFSQAS